MGLPQRGLPGRGEQCFQRKGHKDRGRPVDVPGSAAPPSDAGRGSPGTAALVLVISMSWELEPERTGAGKEEEAGGSRLHGSG